MHHLNIEIKARSNNLDSIRAILQELDADFIGEDHQVDTYFCVPGGRLKLREGTIEESLIHYDRPDRTGPQPSDVTRYASASTADLKTVLVKALGVQVIVDKRREIYFIDNVKFHLDRVEHLGTFVEIEAIGADDEADEEMLRAQCEDYMRCFGLTEAALVARSYSDLMLRYETGVKVRPVGARRPVDGEA